VINSGKAITTNNSGILNISTLTINGNLTTNTSNLIIANTVTINGIFNASSVTNITISGTFTISNDTTTILPSLKNLTINNGGMLTHLANNASKVYYINLSLENIVINSGGSINANGKGYLGGGTDGKGPGINGNPAYDSITNPVDLGSGGEYMAAAKNGGDGGGLIYLSVSGVLINDGVISANGSNGAYVSGGGAWSASHGGNGRIGSGGSGGAGGSIYISASNFSGASSASINANGGSTNNAAGATGGGGRIAVYYTDTTFSGSITAYAGGSTNYIGGAGTIYLKNNSKTYGDLIIDTMAIPEL